MYAMLWDIEMKVLMMWYAMSWYAMRFEQRHHHTHTITKHFICNFMNITLENKNKYKKYKTDLKAMHLYAKE